MIIFDQKRSYEISNLNMVGTSKWLSFYLNKLLQAFSFWGTLWFSAGISYLLVLMTESPIVVIEKMLLST
jgi:hypothetical protein